MTAQGTALTRFRRALQTESVMLAEMAMREIGVPPLDIALDYVALLARLEPARAPRAAVRWHGRFAVETPLLTLSEAHLSLAALAALCDGDPTAIEILRRLLRRTRPADPPRMT